MEGPRVSTLRDQYQVMKQGLRKTFADGECVVEVETKDELVARANELIARWMRVIVLDDGTLTSDLGASEIQGKAGEKYCLISSAIVDEEDNAVKTKTPDEYPSIGSV
jgi:hypothetical protein